MRMRLVIAAAAAMLLPSTSLDAQTAAPGALSVRYMDPANGLTLEQAIARALREEPSLRAARTEIDVARGAEHQAALRPNPTVSFERREEPGGTDNQTAASIQWPLDLFRRSGRIAVAERERTATQLAVADRERLLAAEVRTRYGDVLTGVRDLRVLDELVRAIERQHELLRSRVIEGGSRALDRDLVEVELRRLQSDRLLLAARTEAAMFQLKRVLGMHPSSALALGETLEMVVQRQASAAPASGALSPERSDVREARTRIDVADARIDRSKREGRFDVTLFANYMRMDAGFPQRGFSPDGSIERVRGVFNYVTAGVFVMVPLLNRNQGEVAAAAAERAGAAAAFEAARLTAETEVASGQAIDMRAHEAARTFTGGALTLAVQNLDVVRQTYELGRATVFDVLAEQRRYLDVERAYTDALRTAYEARTALIRALGGVQ